MGFKNPFYNRVFLQGRITADPECFFTSGGKEYAKFTLVVEAWDGKERVPNFFDCIAWRFGDKKGPVDTLAQMVKGAHLQIEGRLKQERWEKEGRKYSKVTVAVDKAWALEWPRDKDQEQGEAPPTGKGPYPEDEIPF